MPEKHTYQRLIRRRLGSIIRLYKHSVPTLVASTSTDRDGGTRYSAVGACGGENEEVGHLSAPGLKAATRSCRSYHTWLLSLVCIGLTFWVPTAPQLIQMQRRSSFGCYELCQHGGIPEAHVDSHFFTCLNLTRNSFKQPGI